MTPGAALPRDAPRRPAQQPNGGGQPPHTPPLSLWLSGGLISVHQTLPLPRSSLRLDAPLGTGSPSGLQTNNVSR